MKVKDLLKHLKDVDPEAEVILQKDAEGNGYSPLAGVESNAVYVPSCDWEGDVYSPEWCSNDVCMEDDEWNIIKAKLRESNVFL